MARYTEMPTPRVKLGRNTTWLTPLAFVRLFGKFDLDPCCPLTMPWRTARVMYHHPKSDGLLLPWRGRVWLNPPLDRVKPWTDKFIAHGNGVALVNVNGLSAAWGQLLMRSADALYIVAGRMAFCTAQGAQTRGKMNGQAIVTMGRGNTAIVIGLHRSGSIRGTMVKRVGNTGK